MLDILSKWAFLSANPREMGFLSSIGQNLESSFYI